MPPAVPAAPACTTAQLSRPCSVPPAFSPTQPPAGALPSALQNKPRPAGTAGHCAGGGVAAGQPAHAAAAVQRRRQFVGRSRRGGGRRRRQRVAAAGKGKFLPRQGFGHRVCARLAVLQPGGELRQFCEGRRAAAALDAPCVETAQAADGPGVRLHRAGLFGRRSHIPAQGPPPCCSQPDRPRPRQPGRFWRSPPAAGSGWIPGSPARSPHCAPPHRQRRRRGRTRPRRPAPQKLPPCRRPYRY